MLPPEKLEGKGGDSLSEGESSRVAQAGLVAGARVEHPKHGFGMVQSFQGATMGHPLYADGTPLKVKVAFDDGQTHEYKTASWHKLRVVRPAEEGNAPGAQPGKGSEALATASKSAGLAAVAPGLVVGARVEHAKHGHGTVQHIAGADLDLKLTKVKVAFDSGQTHEYKGGSLDKLRVVPAVAERDSTVAVKIDPKRRPDPKASAAPAPAPVSPARPKPVRASAGAAKAWDKQPASPDPAERRPELELKVVELVRTPLGLGLAVDKQNKVIELTGGSQAERSGCFAVGDQVISLNGKLLSDKYSASFEQLLGSFALGSKVIIEISAPARETTLVPKSKSPFKPAQPRQPGNRTSNMRSGSAVVAEERVLLEGRMSVRITGSRFNAQSVLKLTVAKASSTKAYERKEPWTTFSYTSNHDTVAVPCRAISTVRMHPGHAQPSFEIEYVGPPKEEPKGKLNKKSLVRMQVWATSQEEFEEWRMALAPLPLTEGNAMDRARAWLEHSISELPEDENDQDGSKRTSIYT